MEALPDIYPLTGLQIGDMQSYVSRAFLYFAPLSKKVFILVDNQPWRSSKQSRSARLWQFMVTKYRMSPFANSRALPCSGRNTSSATAAAAAAADGECSMAARRWFEVVDLRLALHGFLVFEVSWRDVHGINYLNELLTDTSLALEARYMKKWEFYSAEQAAGCTKLWFLGRAPEAEALRGYLTTLYSLSQDNVVDNDDKDNNNINTSTSNMRRLIHQQIRRSSSSESDKKKEDADDEDDQAPSSSSSYTDTLILLRSRDSALPMKPEADHHVGHPAADAAGVWPAVVGHLPAVVPAAVPAIQAVDEAPGADALPAGLPGHRHHRLLRPVQERAAAQGRGGARVWGPLFGWIETWDMVTRIQYLGTILFLRNHLRKCLQGMVALLRMARAVLRPLSAPLSAIAGPLLAACGEVCELLGDLAEALWAPLDAVLDCLNPLVQALLLPLRFAASLASCAGSLLSNTYNFGKDIWETVSSMFELNHMAEAQHSAFDVSLLKSLWNDLFSQIFRAIRSILNGILLFFASCNRHRLSIYNHVQARLRHMLHVSRLAPYSCPCKTKRRLEGHDKDEDDVVECDICK
ncbi:hypothetical protein OsJ_19790 [Oryza sativa Japonica Group]|uniref:Uncharacterized protein n=1 Tax=Oryza sativa subsp. japonica TaxID=39947 RepID=B9FJ19_ORYSJ|nr:hypothetical protein OsJ_19790 [Oryza sativa Japonica Group]